MHSQGVGLSFLLALGLLHCASQVTKVGMMLHALDCHLPSRACW